MRYILFITFSLVLSTYNHAQINLSDLSKIDSILATFEDKPGVAIGILYNGNAIYQNEGGYADIESNTLIDGNTLFQSGAMSMHVTAACILLLENEGKLSLDDPVSKYLPQLSNYKKGNPTIRQCLHHTSGLRDYRELYNRSGLNESPMTDNSALSIIAKQADLAIEPGSDYRYSHSGYLALAAIVEKISRMPFHEYAEKTLFSRFKMNNTYYENELAKNQYNQASNYTHADNEFVKTKSNSNTIVGDRGLITSLNDMMRWAENIRSFKLRNQNLLEKLTIQGKLNSGHLMSYARGVENSKVSGHNVYGHNGYEDGFSSMALYFSDIDLSIVAFSNNGQFYVPRLAYEVAEMIVEEKLSEESVISDEKQMSMPTEHLAQFCKSYFHYGIGYARKIFLENDTLKYDNFEGGVYVLNPVSENTFILEGVRNQTKITFEKNKNNKLVMQYASNGRPSIDLVEFIPVEKEAIDFSAYLGSYRSTELNNTIYKIVEKDGNLEIFLNGEKNSEYRPLMKDIFNSDHDGYLRFSVDKNQFTLNDYFLGSLAFHRIKTP